MNYLNRKRLPAYGQQVLALRRQGLAPMLVALYVSRNWKWCANFAPWRVVVPDDADPHLLDFRFVVALNVTIVTVEDDPLLHILVPAILASDPRNLAILNVEPDPRRIFYKLSTGEILWNQ